ncbi:MAG TPA: hypothetical protein VGC41_04690, partial [Kofleriaceae bacterium]
MFERFRSGDRCDRFGFGPATDNRSELRFVQVHLVLPTPLPNLGPFRHCAVGIGTEARGLRGCNAP